MEKVERSKILVVDDIPANLVGMQTILKALDVEIVKANSGPEALSLLLRHQFAMVLLDVQMPGMNGFETAELMHQVDECQSLPIIFVTAIDKDEHYVTRGYKTGAVDYISKPIDPMRLRAKVTIFLELDQQKKKLSGLLSKKEELLHVVKQQNAQIVEQQELQQDALVKKIEMQDKQNKALKVQRKLMVIAGILGVFSLGFIAYNFKVSADNLTLSDKNVKITQLKDSYKRFIPHEMLGLLEREDIEDVELGDQILRAMSVMFFDVVDFSTITERLSPKETISLINQVLSAVQPEIRKHGGIVNKYLGDGAMVIFPNSEDDAVRAGLGMVQAMQKINEERSKNNLVPLKLGIGISSGPVMVGTVGEKDRMEYTVYGTTVNLASRIEGLTRKYGAYLLINEDVYSRLTLKTRDNMRLVDRVQVKGQQNPATLYEAFGEEAPEKLKLLNDTKSDYEKAIVHYQSGRIKEARALFDKVLKTNETDAVAKFHVAKIDKLLASNSSTNWSSIHVFDTK
ncbi:MAG: response regulator [Deltaproteobacteria bacterium]|nr:response regulator [Deltaproteobacteria bacterium]